MILSTHPLQQFHPEGLKENVSWVRVGWKAMRFKKTAHRVILCIPSMSTLYTSYRTPNRKGILSVIPSIKGAHLVPCTIFPWTMGISAGVCVRCWSWFFFNIIATPRYRLERESWEKATVFLVWVPYSGSYPPIKPSHLPCSKRPEDSKRHLFSLYLIYIIYIWYSPKSSNLDDLIRTRRILFNGSLHGRNPAWESWNPSFQNQIFSTWTILSVPVEAAPAFAVL